MFLNPLFLAGTALVALPIVLHLLMRPKPKHLLFPALRFVKQRHDVNRRTMRVRNWLLLLLRAAAIFLLAIALARPSIQTAASIGSREGPIAAAFICDTLPRMEYRNENQTRLDVARDLAMSLMTELPEDSQIAILDAATSAPSFQIDRAAARQRLERLEIKNVGQRLSSVALRALELLKTSELPKELYILTDMSSGAWDLHDTELTARLDEMSGVAVYVIDVGVANPQNYSLGELRLSAQTLARNTPLNVSTDLASMGLDGERIVESYVINAEGKPEKRSQQIVATKPGETSAVEFVVGGLDVGTHQGFLRLVGGDALPADDRRYFSVEVRPAWKVLVAAPQPAAETAFLFTEALAPQSFRKNGQARFECTVVDYTGLPDATLHDFAGIVLLDPPPLADTTWQHLAAYVEGGGGVAIFVGEAAQPVTSFNSVAARELLPGDIELQARWPDGDLAITPDESEHPMLAKFHPLRGVIAWDGYPVYRYWQLTNLAEHTSVALRYSNTQPAIVERTLGKGRVLMMTTPVSESSSASVSDRQSISDRWNLLATGFEPWPFFMLENELVLYLVGSSDTQLNYVTGQTAVLRLDAQQRRATYLLGFPSGQSQRMSADLSQNTILISNTDEIGDYTVGAGGARDGVKLGFSVNLPTSATQLERIEPDELKPLFGKAEVRFARNRQQIDRAVTTSRTGRELFPLLAVVLAAVLGMEHVLANRFYKK